MRVNYRKRLFPAARGISWSLITPSESEETVTPTGIITAILIGAVVGVLGRLALPGKQSIGLIVTILVGIVSALIGTWLARSLGLPTATKGIDWIELLVQVVVAAVGVALVAGVMGRRSSGVARR